MELTRIEIESYKSIKTPVTISFMEGLPTILIGKNGSGKTNALEALYEIALANTTYSYPTIPEQERPIYRAYIQLYKEDVATILPDLVYDKNKCEIVAYSYDGQLKIDRISSEYIVPALKKEITDIRILISELKNAIGKYEKQLVKISHNGYEEIPICCYEIKNANGGLTNYFAIKNKVEWFINNVRECLDGLSQSFNSYELCFISHTNYALIRKPDMFFRLEYVEPSLASFEQKFVTINRTAIKREITRINNETKDACENIDRLIKEIEERTERIQEGLYTGYIKNIEQEERYDSFLRRVRDVIGKRCLFLKNENNDVIFRTENREYYYNKRSNSIIETYLRQVYKGSDREKLLSQLQLSSNNEWTLSEQAIKDFEAFLNKNIPSFDKDLYNVSVQPGESGGVSIFLNEKNGATINLNKTSAGRRWYFTYYFMKNILESGDVFIIDEPAAMLHPSAQREVFADLIELTERGVKVVYSTHSPYLIPDKRENVHFVTMTENGTEVNGVSSKQEYVSQMTEIVGEDIFDVQSILERYFLAPPDVIARNVSVLIRETQKKAKIKNLEIACDEIGINYNAMRSWNAGSTKANGKKNGKHNNPSPSNVALVLKWAKKHNNLI